MRSIIGVMRPPCNHVIGTPTSPPRWSRILQHRLLQPDVVPYLATVVPYLATMQIVSARSGRVVVTLVPQHAKVHFDVSSVPGDVYKSDVNERSLWAYALHLLNA